MKKNRYKDLEDLLFLGFIPYQARIGDIDFVFKSVSDLEYRKTSLMSGVKDDPLYNSKFHHNYLYHSIFMVNGVSILNTRENDYPEIVSLTKGSPSHLIRMIFDILDNLAERVSACVNLVEPYVYENESRYHWLSKRNTVLNSYEHTGIMGTETLGLNQFQKYWSVLNIREDDKESFEEKYSLAKFLASFTDPKAVRKMEAQDKQKKEEEEKKRERIKIIGTEAEKEKYMDPTASREGIIEELEKQMRGERDDHDKAIEAHERRMRANMLKQMQELKVMKASREKEDDLMEQARPISKEEMWERINKSKNAPKLYMPSIDENESKYFEMSNVRTEDVLRDTGMSEDDYNHMVDDDMFRNHHKKVGKDSFEVKNGGTAVNADKTSSNYVMEQRRLASQIGMEDEETNFDFPNLRNRNR